ncbi:MAG: glycosyltransferase [Clostridia bacterium]|nr:glycosyltransferase [Clostridia bacterium]
MSDFPGVSVMMGAVTETDSLRETVRQILGLCSHEDLREIIIGYSQHVTPESRAVCDELAAMDSDVPIVVFEQKRRGISGLVDMIEAARGSHCVLVASDLAQDLSIVPVMIESAKRDPTVICSASRWLDGCGFYGYGRVRKLVNRAGQVFLKTLFGSSVTDFTNPVQIAPTELYQAIEFENEGFPILLEMVLKPLRLGYEFREIPTNCYARKQGKSNNSLRQTASYFFTAIHIRFMKKQDMLRAGRR